MWYEARTSEDWNLTFDTTPHRFIINGEGPTLLDVSPELDAYTNEDVPYSFLLVPRRGWVQQRNAHRTHMAEGRDDGTNGGLADGIPSVEYQEALFYTYQDENLWTINVTVNDTVNDNRDGGECFWKEPTSQGFPSPRPPLLIAMHAGNPERHPRAPSCRLNQPRTSSPRP